MKVLEVKDVSKSFYSTHALTRVNLTWKRVKCWPWQEKTELESQL